MTIGSSSPRSPHQVDQRGGLAVEALLAPVDHHAADGGVGLHGDLGILDAARADDLEAQLLDGARDLLEAMALEIIGVECRGGDQDGEAAEEVHGILVVGPRRNAVILSEAKDLIAVAGA